MQTSHIVVLYTASTKKSEPVHGARRCVVLSYFHLLPELPTMLRGQSAINFVVNYDFGLGFFTTMAFAATLVYCVWAHGGTLVEAIVHLTKTPHAVWSEMSLAKAASSVTVVPHSDALANMEEGYADPSYGRSTAVSPSKIVPLAEGARPLQRIKSWPQDKVECSVGFGVPQVNQP